MARRFLPVALLVTACAEAPPAAAPRPAVWQQFCEQALSVPHASALAATRGAEGFELVALYNGVLCYKRPADGRLAPPAAPLLPSAAPTAAPAVANPPFVPVVRDPGF